MKDFFNIYNNKKNILNALLSIIATGGIIGVYEIYFKYIALTNTFINIIIFVLFYTIYGNLKSLSKKEKLFSIIFSIILSIIIIIGTQFEINTDISWSFITILKIFSLVFGIFPIISILINYLKKVKINNIHTINYKKLFSITFLIILLFGFLVFLALYPGVYGYDAGAQTKMILYKDVNLTSHFSIPYSFVLTKLILLGKTLFGSYEAGFATYSFIQMLFMSYVATKITIYVVKITKNSYMYLACILLFSLCPLYTVMVISSAQDVFFSGFFALIIINVLNLIYDKNYYKSWYNPLSLVILILLLCLARNNGFYTILVALPFILIFNKNKKIITFIIFLIPLLMYKIYTGPIQHKMGVIKYDTMNEMMSIPSQQIARVYTYNKKSFSKNDIKNLNKYYFNLDNFKYYKINQLISDQSKGAINNDNVSNDLGGYIKFWWKLGIKNPENYVEGFLLNSLGFWFPNKNYHDYRMYHPYIEYKMMDGKFYDKRYLEIRRKSKFTLYEKLLNITLVENKWKRIPVISTFFTTGSYFVTILFLIGISIIKKRWPLFVPLSIILGLYVTLFLSPVCLFRYCFPIFIIMPIIISLILTSNTKRNEN